MSHPTQRRARRGFTLVELMLSVAIMVVVVGMVTTTFLGQSKSLQSSDQARVASESARDALLNLETALRSAGWGVDPRYVIDTTYQCAAGTSCHDKIDGPDELVFVSRNPRYRWRAKGDGGCLDDTGCFTGFAWKIKSVDTTSSPHTVKVDLLAGQVLQKGQVLMATCADGESPVMFTLDAKYGSATLAMSDVVLGPGVGVNAAPYNDAASLKSCHGLAGASLFLVDRSRYFVWTPAGTTTPWLALDTGVDLDGDDKLPPTDEDDLIPLAKNVEDFQVAYVMQAGTGVAPDSNANWVVGDKKGAPENLLLNTASPAPTYTTSKTDASRFTLHPANVRGVRVSIVFRAAREDVSKGPGWTGDTLTAPENRTGTLSGGKVRRFLYTTDINIRNMDSTSGFIF